MSLVDAMVSVYQATELLVRENKGCPIGSSDVVGALIFQGITAYGARFRIVKALELGVLENKNPLRGRGEKYLLMPGIHPSKIDFEAEGRKRKKRLEKRESSSIPLCRGATVSKNLPKYFILQPRHLEDLENPLFKLVGSSEGYKCLAEAEADIEKVCGPLSPTALIVHSVYEIGVAHQYVKVPLTHKRS